MDMCSKIHHQETYIHILVVSLHCPSIHLQCHITVFEL